MATNPPIERPLPQNPEAERSVLGAILLDNHMLDVAVDKLKPEDFFQDNHQRIFARMIELSEERQAIDLITMINRLQRNGELETVGGAAYISQLVDGVPRISNVDHYARIVKEKAVLRRVIHATHNIQQQAMDATEDADAILDSAESSLFEIAENRVRAGLTGMGDLVRNSYDRISRLFDEGKRITGVSTGYHQLDDLTSGLQPSELIVLAARPSVGKSAFAINLASNVGIRNALPVAIFSLEMSKASLLLRLLSDQARIDAHKFRTGQLPREDRIKITTSLQFLSETPLWIDDSGATTVIEMGAKCRRMKRDKGLSLVIIDYLQLVSARGRFNTRNEEVASITRGLKAMAKDLEVPVVVLSQLTRAPEREDRGPVLSDLRDSGAIEQDADVVMFLHRPKMFKEGATPEERGETQLIIAKQRNGPTDMLRFVFLQRYTLFEEAAPATQGM
ncbi:MAG TPA: replicative DNA helicase [Candidatus Limnocylindrales bacterium]|nr:replicative DNA helicase [Candidatus Limnocylindrales bacterium]